MIAKAPMRALALVGLLLMQDPDVDALLKHLSDDSIEVREKATAALIGLGEKVEDKVKAFQAGASADAKSRCQAILTNIRRARRVREVCPPVKKVTLKFKDASLKDALKSFQEQTGWSVHIPKEDSASITLDLKEAMPFEAVQAIALGAQADYRIDNEAVMERDMDPDDFMSDRKRPPRLRFESREPPARPILLKSRYAVALSRIDLWRSTDFGTPLLKADLMVNLLCPPDLKPDDSSRILIDMIKDDTGAMLFDRSKAFRDLPGFDPLERRIDFQYPDRKARKLASIKGRASIRYLLSDERMTFEAPEKSVGVRKTYKDVEILLKSWKRDGDTLTFVVEVSGTRPEIDDQPYLGSRGIEGSGILIQTKDGKLWSSGHMKGGPPGKGPYPIELNFNKLAEEVTAVVIIVERDFHSEEFEFEFKDIPLP